MTLYNGFQLVIAAVVVALTAERFRVLFYRAPIDTDRFIPALLQRVRDGKLRVAEQLSDAGRPSWVPTLLHAMIHAYREAEGDPSTAADMARDEQWDALRDEAGKRLHAIRGLASVASAVGLLGVLLEFREALSEGANLLVMEAGSPQTEAIQHALVTMTIGMATSWLCYAALRMLREQARGLAKAMKENARRLSEALAEMPALASTAPDEVGSQA